MLARAYAGGNYEHSRETSWKAIEVEKLNDLLSRQMISGDNATVAQILLKRGAVVPRHSHVNEQYSWIISGKLKLSSTT